MKAVRIEELFTPRMPEVDIRPDIETIFSRARSMADESVEDEAGLFHCQIVVVTPGRLLAGKPCPLPAQVPVDEIKRLKKLAPPKPRLQIAAIAYTALEALQTDMTKAIPFIGYLLGFGMLGHAVWIFEGHPTALAAGCRDADMLVVDGGMLPFLSIEPDWQATALGAMRGKAIKLIPREKS